MTSTKYSICVFCGARAGANAGYVQAAEQLGAAMAGQNWRLVFGAGDKGIMGAVAAAHARAGGVSLGVIPTHLMGFESANAQGDTLIITENMHERKKVMFMNSDAIVILPGGAGSLDEFFEVLTWRQIGLHTKPIYLLNINDYWAKLIQLLDHVIAEEFASPSLLDYVTLVDDVAGAVSGLSKDFSRQNSDSE